MEQVFEFRPQGVCSRKMTITHEDGIIKSLVVEGGCRGNLAGISALVKGMKIDDVIARLEGVQCHNGTSCPDQLSVALKQIKESQK